MNIQSKEEAYHEKADYQLSAQSNSWFLSMTTGELFLLASLATRSFPWLRKTFFIFRAGCKFVLLVLSYDLPAVLAFVSNFYQLLPLLNTLPALLGKLLDLQQIWLDAFTSVSILSKMVSNLALSSNCFWLPLNFSCTTSLSSLLLCSICFPLSSNFFLKKIFKHGKDLINGC